MRINESDANYSNLESLVDRYGLSDVLDALARICIEKGEHVLVSYGDKTTAKAWDRAHKPVIQAAHHAAVSRVSD